MTQTLLDTDTLTLLHKRHSQVIRHSASHVRQFGCLIFSELSYYEVTRGLKAIGATAQLARFEQFCQVHRILPFSHAAAALAADIWSDLKRRGLLIGEVDILIAGIALSEGLAVATHNTGHFNRIAGLQVVDWTL
ncbi:MAG TPA: PIN domain-containing protein [Blastocatellia bacterium]|nr:PIN domain-containing protein [Blastocatellia bacterium]